jgi:hypothetical protein
MNLAKQSRQHVLAATGLGRSGNEQIFLQAWEGDMLLCNGLKSKLEKFDSNYSNNPGELETLIVTVHRLGSEANQLKSKYQLELAKDDKSREQIHADVQARVAATLRPPGT